MERYYPINFKIEKCTIDVDTAYQLGARSCYLYEIQDDEIIIGPNNISTNILMLEAVVIVMKLEYIDTLITRDNLFIKNSKDFEPIEEITIADGSTWTRMKRKCVSIDKEENNKVEI